MQTGTDKTSEIEVEHADKPYLNEHDDSLPEIILPDATEPTNPLSSQNQQQQSQQPLQQHATWQHQQHPRHMLNKFATIHSGDKYHQDLRRDLLTNFDRNLTVETAHFDSQLHSSAGPTMSSSSTATVRRGPMPYPSGLGTNTGSNDRPKSSTKKRRRPAPTSGTASPAEVFHRHLVDAVSNAEDSEDNEGYVYPYAYSNSGLQDNMNGHSSGQPLQKFDSTVSISSVPPGAPEIGQPSTQSSQPHQSTSMSDLFNDMFQPPPPPVASRKDDNEQDQEWQYEDYRPKMRNVVPDRDHYMRSSRIRPFSGSSDQYKRKYDKGRDWSGIHSDMEGYTTDDEGVPLLSRKTFRPGQLKKRILDCPQVLLIILVGMGMVMAFMILLASWTASPLGNVKIKMGRVLATDKELIFDLHVHAVNYNWWTLHISTADLGVFASSKLVPNSLFAVDNYTHAAEPAEYLGSLYHFDEALYFPARIFSGDQEDPPTSQLRIKSPGADKGGNERWSRMIRYPYALIVRGVLRYPLLPFIGTHVESVAVCKVAHVDPATGKVSDEQDQSFCLSDE